MLYTAWYKINCRASLPGGSLIESFRFWDEDNYKYEISSKKSATSFSKNVIVAGTNNQNFRSLIILQPGKSQTFSNKNNPTNFSGEKQYNEAFQVEYFLKIRDKPLS